jgi:hypothetical protein
VTCSERADVSLDAARIGVVVAHPSGVIGVDHLIDKSVVEPVVQVDEQLPDPLVFVHGVDRASHPANRVVVQSVWSRAEVRLGHR